MAMSGGSGTRPAPRSQALGGSAFGAAGACAAGAVLVRDQAVAGELAAGLFE